MKATTYYFTAKLSYAECEDLYRDQIKYIVVTEAGGKRIQLPKHNMQRFITPLGIKGSFEMIVDDKHKIVSIKQLS